ncbi:MAG: Beta-galactosidase [Candidatus Hinthialibacteria bacterium OLB16]|nr:MAG: Beta-galactosidase [Candidatus Hinthialibacteria bacterium OLB16]
MTVFRFILPCLLAALVTGGQPTMGKVLDSEFIKVSSDQRSFIGKESGERFIPWGSNLVLRSKDDLNIFGPRYTPERYEQILIACQNLKINLLKVFLPISNVLPDPQPVGGCQIAPGYIENLINFLDLCQKHEIRAVVTLTEWGGNGVKWWHDGGQYWGRSPWKTDPGIDSIDVLRHFWLTLASQLKTHPSVFSYTPAVEWTLPASNLTWFPPDGSSSVVSSPQGIFYWRAWLMAKYKTLEGLNTSWGTQLASWNDVQLPNYEYISSARKYKSPDNQILDYQNFRDWSTLRYFKPQIEAIRQADPNHLVTISNHMRFWNLWEGAAFGFLGATPFEQKKWVDYVTFHANFSETDPEPGRTDEEIVRYATVLARFCDIGVPRPLMLEEFVFASTNPQRVAEVQSKILQGTLAHVSGWTTWYLQFPENPQQGADPVDLPVESSWLDSNLNPTPWGLAAAALAEEVIPSQIGWKPPIEVVPVSRRDSLVPKSLSLLTRHIKDWARRSDLTGYNAPHEPDLDILLDGDPYPILDNQPDHSHVSDWQNQAPQGDSSPSGGTGINAGQ